VNPLSLRLTYRISKIPFQPETVNSVKRAYGIDIGEGQVYGVFVSFRTREGWTGLHRMIYDTGAVVSLLPLRFYNMLGVQKYAPIKLTGIAPEVEVKARLTRVRLRLEDIEGNLSPEIETWVAIAERDDVPRVIGLKDIANTHRLTVDPKEQRFYLDFCQKRFLLLF